MNEPEYTPEELSRAEQIGSEIRSLMEELDSKRALAEGLMSQANVVSLSMEPLSAKVDRLHAEQKAILRRVGGEDSYQQGEEARKSRELAVLKREAELLEARLEIVRDEIELLVDR